MLGSATQGTLHYPRVPWDRVSTHEQPGNQAMTQLEMGVLLERGSAVCGNKCTVVCAVLRRLSLVVLPLPRLCWLGCYCLLSLVRASINSACPRTARVLPLSFYSHQLPLAPFNSGFWNSLTRAADLWFPCFVSACALLPPGTQRCLLAPVSGFQYRSEELRWGLCHTKSVWVGTARYRSRYFCSVMTNTHIHYCKLSYLTLNYF